MATVVWGRHQREHIEAPPHRVTAAELDQAWHDPHRQDVAEQHHAVHGACTLSLGFTHADGMIELWRYQRGDPNVVFPITAYEPEDA